MTATATQAPVRTPIPDRAPCAVLSNGRRYPGHVLAYDARTAEYTVQLKVSIIRAHCMWVVLRRGTPLASTS